MAPHKDQKMDKSARMTIGLLRRVAISLMAVLLFLPSFFILLLALAWKAGEWLHRNHEKARKSTHEAAQVSKVIATIGTFWAWLVAPSGVAAIGASLGIVSTPFIVVLAPLLVAFAASVWTISAIIDLYSKWLRRQRSKSSESSGT